MSSALVVLVKSALFEKQFVLLSVPSMAPPPPPPQKKKRGLYNQRQALGSFLRFRYVRVT